MNKIDFINLLVRVKNSKFSLEDAVALIQTHFFEDLGHTKVDHHRKLRQGECEIIFGENKTTLQLKDIILSMLNKNYKNIIVTRISRKTVVFLKKIFDVAYYSQANIVVVAENKVVKKIGNIVIASGGTSDIPICEEAAITAETLGSKVNRLYDVGVAGIHRLLSNQDMLQKARVIIAVAGMEGALVSVIGGLISYPVIAVTTSIG